MEVELFRLVLVVERTSLENRSVAVDGHLDGVTIVDQSLGVPRNVVKLKWYVLEPRVVLSLRGLDVDG